MNSGRPSQSMLAGLNCRASASSDQLLDGLTHDFVQHPDVLAQVDRAIVGGRRDSWDSRARTAGACRSSPGPHTCTARRHSQRTSARSTPLRSTAVRARANPAGPPRRRRPRASSEETRRRSPGPRPHPLLGLEPRRLQQPARELTRTRDGVALAAGLHLQHRRFQRHDSAGADTVQRRDFAGRRLELPMDHAGETRQGEISLRRGGRQKIDDPRCSTGPVDGVPHRARGHLGIGEQRPLVAVDRVVPRPDAVLFEDSLRARDGFPRSSRVTPPSTRCRRAPRAGTGPWK